MADAEAPSLARKAPKARPDLTQGPIAKALILFAIPTFASNVLQSLNGSVNAVWIGRFLGEEALAATANANIIMFLLFSAVFGFGMASTVLVGQAVGRRDIDGARRAFGAALGFCLILSVIVSCGGWFAAAAILKAMSTPAEAYPLALIYLRVIFLAMPAMLITTMLMMGMRGVGDAMTPLWFMIVAVILDAGLNPVFILGLGPAPRMGIAGAAVATLIANIVSLAALVAYVYAKDLPLRLRGAELRYLNPAWPLLKVILAKGFPMGMQMVVMTSASLVMMGLVNREGLLTSAAYGATQQLWTYVQMPMMAIGAAASAMAAQNIGAGRWDRVDRITWAGIITTLVFTTFALTLLLAFDRPALALFLGGSSPAIEVARHIQYLVGWSFLLFGISMSFFGTMRANGVVIAPLIVLGFSLYVVRIGFYWVSYPLLGADALWWSFSVGSFAACVLAGLLYYRSNWRQVRLMTPVDAEEARESVNAESEPAGRLTPNG